MNPIGSFKGVKKLTTVYWRLLNLGGELLGDVDSIKVCPCFDSPPH
jgi:hypothetical protein